MRYLLTLTAAFIALIDARVQSKLSWPELNSLDIDIASTTKASDPKMAIADGINLWQEVVNRGVKLMTGMKSDDATAATLYGFPTDTAESPFSGSLMEDLREWGYDDNTPVMKKSYDIECNMTSTSGYMLSKAFADLGLGTASKCIGGPNQCFQIEHCSGSAMIKNNDGTLPDKREQCHIACGITYRATGAEDTLGVNAAAGALFPLNRAVSATLGASIDDVKYFTNMMIINEETNQYIREILKTLEPPLDKLPGWPGVEFGMESEEGKAPLGSPIGRWAG